MNPSQVHNFMPISYPNLLSYLKPAARFTPWLVGVALLLPLMFSSPWSHSRFHLGLPAVWSGDEPHYLVMINSLILDGDLDLANNYAAVHAGADQAGKYFAGTELADHTVWYEHGERRQWLLIYDYNHWNRGKARHLLPPLNPGRAPPSPGHPEYSMHPPGVALLLAPVLFPFRGTIYVEPLAIFCSTLAIIAAMLLFRTLAQKYTSNRLTVELVTAVTFLGTPAWNYGRTLFNEPYLLLFAIGAYSLALRDKSPLLAGVFVGLGMLMKPPFALFIIPLALMYLIARDFRSTAFLLLPAILSFAAILGMNDYMFGGPLRTSQDWLPGDFITGAIGVLFSARYGYLFTAPAIIAAIAAWPAFIRAHRRDSIVLLSAIMLYFVLFASYLNWAGSTCYAARYEVPLLPLLFVAMVKLPETRLWQVRSLRTATVIICLLSITGNAFAAMPYWRWWDSNAALALVDEARHLHGYLHYRLKLRI